MIPKDSIQYGTTTIIYDIVYSERRKHGTLAVYPMKKVQITVPQDLEREKIKKFVRNKAGWVIKKLDWFDEIAHHPTEKEYVNGETFYYLGRQYRLKILEETESPTAKLIGKYLTVTIPAKTSINKKKLIKTLVYQWYCERLSIKLKPVIKKYERKLGVQVSDLKIRNQSKRWGSCTKNGILFLNTRIAMAPMSQVEYIVAHEICHIKHKKHSREFWRLLESVLPDYEKRKEELKDRGWEFTL